MRGVRIRLEATGRKSGGFQAALHAESLQLTDRLRRRQPDHAHMDGITSADRQSACKSVNPVIGL